VNWRRVQHPKQLGGLGILELEKFIRALCLRWQWQQWTQRQKPWSELLIQATDTETELFRACTVISLGDGTQTSFWSDNSLQGTKPKEITLTLFTLARRKNISVA
jgi:hypothetical protein